MEAALAHVADLAVRLFEAHIGRTAAILMDLDAGAAGNRRPAWRRGAQGAKDPKNQPSAGRAS